MSTTSSAQSQSFRIPVWLPYVVFVAATVFFFRGHIFGTAFFWDDFAEYVYPVRAFAARHIANGEIPFWNPYSFCGMPFMADVQTALFYPPNLIVDLLSGGTPYPIKNLQLLIIVHFFIAQCSMYLLSRGLNVSIGGSMIAALSYGFSSPLVLHAFHPMQVEHLAWLPLLVLFVHAAVTRQSLLHAVIGGLFLGMTMLSGSPQMTLYIALLLGVLTLWFAIGAIIRKTYSVPHALHALVLGLLPLAIGFGIFCVQYLPVREIAALSERAEISYEKASVGSLESRQLICATVPKAFGSMSADQQNKAPFFLHERDYYLYWDTAFYCGVVAFILGLFGALCLWRTQHGGFLIAIAAFAFLFALGSNGFVFPAFFQLPFFNALRIPARMMFMFSFAFCVLAGLGFDELSAKMRSNAHLYRVVGAAVFPAICALGVMTGSLVDIPNERMESVIHSFGSTALLFVALTFVLMFLSHRDIIKPTVGALLLCIVVFVDLYAANGDFNLGKTNPVKESQSMFPENLQAQLLPHKPDSIYRVSMRIPGVIALKRNQGMTDGVMLYEGYNQLLLAKRHPAVTDFTTRLDLLGVKYEVQIDSARGSAGFVQRPNYFPNAWMVYQAVQATESTAAARMKDSIDFHNTAVVEEPLTSQLSGLSSGLVEHAVHCTEYGDNHTSYNVSTASAGLLCFSEIWYPDWKVYVDGKPAKVLRTNSCFRGVEVPAGQHTVEWRFESASFRSGFNITLATLVVSVALLIVVQIRSMKKYRSAQTSAGVA